MIIATIREVALGEVCTNNCFMCTICHFI